MPPSEPGRDPLLRDGAIVVGVAVAMLINGVVGEHAKGIDALGVLAVLGTTTPLIARRYAPELVLGVVAAGIFACLATLKPVETIALAPMVAAYTVAVQRGRAAAIRAGVSLIPVVLLATAVFNPHAGALYGLETLKHLALIGLPLVLGVGVRDRRAYVTAMRERAERAEHAREEETLRRVGEERLRIAREVHDVVAHAMVAINVQAGVAAHVIDRRPEAARDALSEIKRVSGESLSDLRSTLGVLREPDGPAPTRPTPGVDALPELADRMRSAGLEIELSVERGTGLPGAVDAAAYRIVQEALTNTLRHAGGGRAEVRVTSTTGALELEVLDDGATAPQHPTPGSGHGLDGMRERAASAGGAVEAGPRANGGWRVWARLPLLAADRA